MESGELSSFIRWQGVTRGYFTAVSNVVLGLSTGLLAFLLTGLVSAQSVTWYVSVFVTMSLIFLAMSVGVAVWCAVNRLKDFRATAKIARARSTGNSVQSEKRLETKILGNLSWRLFWWQLVLFAFGAVFSSVAVIVSLWL